MASLHSNGLWNAKAYLHKDSGIVNDANDWAIETMNDPSYPLNLFLQ
jgi:hypothetical protein